MKFSATGTIALLAVAVGLSFNTPEGLPPVCDAGNVLWVECDGPVSTCPLDGRASYDPEQDQLTYYWEDDNPYSWFSDPTSPTPVLFVDMGEACSVECGAIRLTVTDPTGQSSTCTTAVMFEDTTPPSLVRPADVLVEWDGGWPFQTDPAVTGQAIGVDVRDPNPLVYYRDVVSPGMPPSGIEQVVHRTWFARDMCGLEVTDMQTITIVGPSFYDIVTMDLMPGSCPNYFSTRSHGTFTVTLFGDEEFFAGSSLDLGLCRADGAGTFCNPIWGSVVDAGSPVPGTPCGSLVPDGYLDLVLTFDVHEAIDVMGLRALGDSTNLMVELQGTDPDGQPFATRDSLLVINLQARDVPFKARPDTQEFFDF